ncbi:hypothetical protein OESDEN_23551 [Oesophagostomum dentatum]|uniref:Uncharacterized protein n=1 Tax=Oesophagostomum dentatum TaxID=61180 RepID=A0A0B1RVV8_OESDE|nr:hypothetical protein OESDEN_23551 [Oesophagostomum dentatum]
MKYFVPVFVSGTQVQICQNDLGGCPRHSRCMTSTIPTVSICCQPYQLQVSGAGANSVMARPLGQQRCKNGNHPLAIDGSSPCEFSSTGQAVCCGDRESIRCPAGSKAYEYGGRPLACPVGSTK